MGRLRPDGSRLSTEFWQLERYKKLGSHPSVLRKGLSRNDAIQTTNDRGFSNKICPRRLHHTGRFPEKPFRNPTCPSTRPPQLERRWKPWRRRKRKTKGVIRIGCSDWLGGVIMLRITIFPSKLFESCLYPPKIVNISQSSNVQKNHPDVFWSICRKVCISSWSIIKL
jgi:hypothetical protein